RQRRVRRDEQLPDLGAAGLVIVGKQLTTLQVRRRGTAGSPSPQSPARALALLLYRFVPHFTLLLRIESLTARVVDAARNYALQPARDRTSASPACEYSLHPIYTEALLQGPCQPEDDFTLRRPAARDPGLARVSGRGGR